MKEAMLYEKLEDGVVRCNLCGHRCLIKRGATGVCKVRENRGGTLHSLVYGKSISAGIDPIEKKPFFHFHPGSRSLSIATVGCNFRCLHCQNATISQMVRDEKEIAGQNLPPQRVVALAVSHGCRSISYTYTEPTIFYEYARDTMIEAKKKGIHNNFVTNGFMTGEAIEGLCGLLDAANVDLKAFTADFYKKVCGAELQVVLDSIRALKGIGVWIEITTLVIPGYNDSSEELERIASFIAEVGVEIPWHISRFHPSYKLLDVPTTPVDTLRRGLEIGKKCGLKYVYSGNVLGDEGENTYCPSCGRIVIERFGFRVIKNGLEGGKCPCGEIIDGISM